MTPRCRTSLAAPREAGAHLDPQGKNLVPVTELHAGDIGAVAKLRDTLTGDTHGRQDRPDPLSGVTLPEPAITFAIEPKSRNDEDKLRDGLHKLMEEDPMVRFFRDQQTKEFLIAGTGQQHIEVMVSKLKRRYHTEVEPESAESSVSRNDPRQGRRAGPPQETDRRARPVRRLQDQDGTAGARQASLNS